MGKLRFGDAMLSADINVALTADRDTTFDQVDLHRKVLLVPQKRKSHFRSFADIIHALVSDAIMSC